MKWIIVLVSLAMAGCATAKKQDNATLSEAAKAETVNQASNTPTEKVTSGARKISCAKGEETRVLEVAEKNGGCTLNYTKAGKAAAVSSSVHGTQHCIDSLTKIRTKLETAGYSCK